MEWLVFSQSAEPSLDVAAWDAHARRFFDARLVSAGVGGPGELRVVVTPKQGPAGERTVVARLRTAHELALAEEAEVRQGGGLGLLARRCPTVWSVACDGPDDRVALLLAAVLAGVGLGPIVDPRGPEIFGVKTARAKLQVS